MTTPAELRELLAKATAPPWSPSPHLGSGPENAALIVAAINALPALLDVVEATEKWKAGGYTNAQLVAALDGEEGMTNVPEHVCVVECREPDGHIASAPPVTIWDTYNMQGNYDPDWDIDQPVAEGREMTWKALACAYAIEIHNRPDLMAEGFCQGSIFRPAIESEYGPRR